MKAPREAASLRRGRVFFRVREAIAAAHKDSFRVLAFSVQGDHVHLIAEASDEKALSSGMRGLSVRIGHAVNRCLDQRGRFFVDRYHARPLKTPREVRNAFVYVLMNDKHHGHRELIDACSSARWFDGFRPPFVPAVDPPTRPARTWLARIGWRRRGLIDLEEAPAPHAPRQPRDAQTRTRLNV
jgi:hypothetical protein